MHRKVYKRPDDDGLTDALFDAMELLRDGAISHQEATAFAMIAQAQIAQTENKHRAQALELERRRQQIEENRSPRMIEGVRNAS